MVIELDMVQTIALAVVMLLLGEYLVKRVSVLERYCIPSPVVGGLIFAIIALMLKSANIVEFYMDETLKNITMTMFFTSVGLGASIKELKKGGKKVIMFVFVAIGLVILQNVVAVGTAVILDQDPLLGMATGSIPMTGGHGTAGSLGVDVRDAGLEGGDVIAIAAATFGLVAGSMLGGPVGKSLIEKNKLSANDNNDNIVGDMGILDDPKGRKLIPNNFYVGTFQILIAMGIGTVISVLLGKTGLNFPSYIGAMIAGAIIRNISDITNKYEVPSYEIEIIGGISLSLFLSIALMVLKLWELKDLAGPMVVILIAQTLLMFLYARFITFNVMGRDYDAAILAAGHCGFGLGATPNGIANMTSVTERFGPSPTAFFILPLAGSLFIDFVNPAIIAAFLNFIAN